MKQRRAVCSNPRRDILTDPYRMMKIYLASASPRRREIMEKIGIDAEIRVSGADEDTGLDDPVLLVEELSTRKAVSVADEIDADETADTSQGYCVIGADTVVSIDGRILGKPADEDDARSMLRMLSGRMHQVYTGVSLVISRPEADRGEGGADCEVIVFHEKTDVEFCEMTDDEIDAYIATGDPMDKAGAYGVQSYAAPFVSAIYGDYYNAMGLPASRLYHELKAHGVLGQI